MQLGARRLLRMPSALALALALAACPRATRQPLVPAPPTDGDPEVRRRFVEARDRFLRDGSAGDELAELARTHPDDPVAPQAGLYAGLAAYRAGDLRGALDVLAPALADAEPTVAARAALYAGLAHGRLGEAAAAAPLLARGEAAIADEVERGAWLAASAAAAVAVAPLTALPWLDRYWGVADDAERGWILATLEAVVAAAAPMELQAAWDGLADRGGPAAAVLGPRLAAALVAAGSGERAERVRAAAVAARRGLGMADPAAGPPAVGRLGAVLPLAGRQARVAEAAARGLAVAAGAHGPGPVAAPGIELDVVDAAGATASAAAMDALAAAGAVAVVGAIDGESADAAAARAEHHGLALVTLNPRADERPAVTPQVFHAMHSAEGRARVLARRAAALGVRRFAVLAPDTGYGRAAAAAFVAQVEADGGVVAVRTDYAADTRSFAKLAGALDGSWDAVFVPEQAERLELIAPALAAAGLTPRPHGAPAGRGAGRPVLLLSTAEALEPGFLRDAGRHAAGALLAPGFYPDRDDPVIGPFVTRFEAAHGRLPTAVDAYAHDAALALAAAATATGSAGRRGVARALEAVVVDGATGRLRFGADHRRADDGVVFVVAADGADVTAAR